MEINIKKKILYENSHIIIDNTGKFFLKKMTLDDLDVVEKDRHRMKVNINMSADSNSDSKSTPMNGDYIGQVLNDLPNGYGRVDFQIYLVSGDKDVPAFYLGEFRDGYFHGFGLFYISDENFYLGNFANGSYQGNGLLSRDETIYSGNFPKCNRENILKVAMDCDFIITKNIILKGSIKNSAVVKVDTVYWMNPSEVKLFVK